MSTSLGEQTRQEKLKRLERRIEELRAERNRMTHRAEKAIAARKEMEECVARAEELLWDWRSIALGFLDFIPDDTQGANELIERVAVLVVDTLEYRQEEAKTL